MASFGTFFAGALSLQERACLSSFIRLGHSIALFSYERCDLPRGLEWRDAAEIVPRSGFWRAETGPHKGSCGQFSDGFRYRMIAATGLTWVDTDIFCLRADWPEDPLLIGAQDRVTVNGAVLRFPRDHPALRDAIEVTERIGRIPVWGLVGPQLLTALVREHGLASLVLPTEAFYPVQYSKAALLVQPRTDPVQWPSGSYCVHLWNEILRLTDYDRAAGPPPGSPMRALFDLVAER